MPVSRAYLLPLVACLTAPACAHGSGDASRAPGAARADDDPSDDVPGEEGDEPPAIPASSLSSASPAPRAGAANVALLGEVDRELGAMRSSTYSHRTRVDEASGAFDYDCSGFLVYALSRAAPDALAAVQATTNRRPRSSEIVAFLESVPAGSARGRWEHVARVQDLKPGDVVVWLKPPESRSSNTGHTMIVHGAVTPDPSEPGAFVVPVADSTGQPHAPGDARSAEQRTGLGQGEIVLVTDANGAPIGYRWSRGAKSREKRTTIALGRLR